MQSDYIRWSKSKNSCTFVKNVHEFISLKKEEKVHMKKKQIIFLVLFAVFLIIYYARTTNLFFSGSNTFFLKDIFTDYGSQWICDCPEMQLTVFSSKDADQFQLQDVIHTNFAQIQFMEKNTENHYFMIGESGRIRILEQQQNNQDGSDSEINEIMSGYAEYKKGFFSGRVTSMTINVKTDALFDGQYKKLLFKKASS